MQSVIEHMCEALGCGLIVFTIAHRPEVWRATTEASARGPGAQATTPCNAVGPVSHRAVRWAYTAGLAASAAAIPCEGTLVWTGPGAALRSGLGEGLVGLLRLAARLFVTQHSLAESPTVRPAPQEALASPHNKQHFVHVAAHALRSPIMTLRMQMENMGRALSAASPNAPVQADKLKHRMQRAVSQCDALVGLSDNLLDVCTLQHQPLQLTLEKTDLVALTHRVAKRFEGHARHAHCSLILDAQGPMTGSWDAPYLERAIANLVDNAIRYAPGAPIYLRLRRKQDAAHVLVQDSGPGIAAPDMGRLFERFERGQPMLNSGGWGLGLYLTRHIVEAHQGQVDIAERNEPGCTMHVSLPLCAG